MANDDKESGNKRAVVNEDDDIGKRKRTKTNRYGQSDTIGNKDHYFEDSDSDSNNNTTITTTDSVEISDDSEVNLSGADKTQECSKNVLRNQVSRIEAKIDNIQDVIEQIQRMVISLTNGSTHKNGEFQNLVPKLPLTTEESVNQFETDLNDSAFRQSIVDFLSTINGTNGTKNGGKIIRSVVFTTICPTILNKYTWTGNSSKHGQKNDFRQKKNIFDVFFAVIHAYDKKYTRSDCEDDLKQRIFKHVKGKAVKISQAQTSSQILTAPNETLLPTPQVHASQPLQTQTQIQTQAPQHSQTQSLPPHYSHSQPIYHELHPLGQGPPNHGPPLQTPPFSYGPYQPDTIRYEYRSQPNYQY